MPQRDSKTKPLLSSLSNKNRHSCGTHYQVCGREGSCSNRVASAAAPPQGAEDPDGSRAWENQKETSTAPAHGAVPAICRYTRPHPTEMKLVSEDFCKMHNTVVF